MFYNTNEYTNNIILPFKIGNNSYKSIQTLFPILKSNIILLVNCIIKSFQLHGLEDFTRYLLFKISFNLFC